MPRLPPHQDNAGAPLPDRSQAATKSSHSLMNGRTVLEMPRPEVAPVSTILHISGPHREQEDYTTVKPRIFCEPDTDSVFFSDDHQGDGDDGGGGGGCLWRLRLVSRLKSLYFNFNSKK